MATKESNSVDTTSALKLIDIVKDYGSGENVVHALRGINLDFRKSEFVSILGPSGCGKTTLLNIIGGLDRYTSGDLIIDGVSTKQYKDADWDTYRNNSIGFVFQSYNLIPHQSVNSNVELALTLSGISKSERKKRVEKVLEQVGLQGLGHKKPNQLSGGQMQRVAIARALINDPEIILADEPTGALDTETSVQIMELLKEVAKDRLVIMVTHNPELAKQYSTRIINLLDGEMTGDTNPVKTEVELKKPAKKKKSRAKMGLLTALFLSLSNLATKRGRTILTSFAGSIGIIGIALVLAVSTGFSGYMSKLQTDTMSTYPVTISEASVDLSAMEDMVDAEVKEKFPVIDKYYKQEFMSNMISMLKPNNLSDEFLTYLKADEKKHLYYDIQYDYGFDMNDYLMTDIPMYSQYSTVKTPTFQALDAIVETIKDGFRVVLSNSELGQTMTVDTIRSYIPTIQEMPNSTQLIDEQYDLIYGEKIDMDDPSSYNKMYLVVDKYNRISDITLALLGLTEATYDTDRLTFTFDGAKETDFADVVSYTDADGVYHEGKTYYVMSNDDYYTRIAENEFVPYELMYMDQNSGRTLSPTEVQAISGKTFDSLEKITIAGVLRMKEDTTDGVLKQGLAYTKHLTDKVLDMNLGDRLDPNDDTEIVKVAREKGEANVTTLKITKDENGLPQITYSTKAMSLRVIAGKDTPAKLSIYPKDFESKEEFKAYIDARNKLYYDEEAGTGNEDDPNIIYYSDMMSMIFDVMNTIVDSVSYVLIAFTAISLVVSSIMIGIITYVSVVERTKEIGVLRSIGARKKDISRIFNAETFLIGLFAGLAGIVIAYLLTIPINLLLGSFIQSTVPLVALKVTHALILVAVSITLTLISGIIPSRIAAKKDPVVALRSE